MESEMAENVFVPQVPVNCIPRTGQEFNSHEDAFHFYNAYAREGGFSTRIQNSKKRKDSGETYWKQFVCYKEGKTNDTYQLKHKNAVPRKGERNRGQTRVGCNARLTVVKQQTGESWVVKQFIEQHNHGLTTPSRVHFLRSHRTVSATKKALTQQFAEANIPTCQQMRIMEIDAGGPSSVGCRERDLRNYAAKLREERRGHDAEALIEQFAFKKEKDPNFFYAFETDAENKFVRCFWADSESQRSYAYFGDCVVFDTTYNTNEYAMILAPFVGVNNHRQTITFGCGLLSDETTESFVWLISKFVEAMPNNRPLGVIITDQDAAISNAISVVLPSTMHRYCIWHILNKFAEKINVMLHNDEYHRLVNIVKQSESPEEFEHRWNDIMATTNLGTNDWLRTMYQIRSRWVPAYVKHVFSAGMSSSQRSESSHSFLKKFVNRNCSLLGFLGRFNRALAHQRDEELSANHIDISEKPRLNSNCLMERQMVQIYTKKIFIKFQKEIEESHSYICSKKVSHVDLEDVKVYYVSRFEEARTCDRHRELTYYSRRDFVACSCRMFEFEGCPCRHMLCFWKKKQVLLLDEKYILRRWTKNAKEGSLFDDQSRLSVEDGNCRSLMARHGILSKKAALLVDQASLTDSRTAFLLSEFEILHSRLQQFEDGSPVGITKSSTRNSDVSVHVGDPKPVRAKGCGKRIKGSKEIALRSLGRQCGICDGKGHDRRRCPQRLRNSVNALQEPSIPEEVLDVTPDIGGEEGTYTSFCSSYDLGGSELH